MSETYNIPEENSLDFMEGLESNEISNTIEKNNSIVLENITSVKEHIGESFETEKINISRDTIMDFVHIIGDINQIHFNPERVKESVFSEESEGRIFVPGVLTQSLWTNKEALHSALIIKEPHEIILKSTSDTKFLVPIFAGADIVYKFKVEEVTDSNIKSRKATEVVWKVIGSTLIKGRMRPCFSTKATVLYVSLD